MKYKNKDICFTFVVDYGISHPKDHNFDMIIYEVQDLATSNNTVLNAKNNSDDVIIQGLKFFFSKRKVIDYPSYLLPKWLQRELFDKSEILQKYSPKFKVITNNTPDYEIRTWLFKNKIKDIVVKKEGALGNGNTFCKDVHLEWVFRKFYENHVKPLYTKDEGKFVIEEIKMPNYNVGNQKYKKLRSLGCYRRNIIFYNSETGEINSYEVYKNILNKSETTNNHCHEDICNLKEKGYLLGSYSNYIEKYNKKYLKQRNEYKNFFDRKNKVFANLCLTISKEIFEGLKIAPFENPATLKKLNQDMLGNIGMEKSEVNGSIKMLDHFGEGNINFLYSIHKELNNVKYDRVLKQKYQSEINNYDKSLYSLPPLYRDDCFLNSFKDVELIIENAKNMLTFNIKEFL